LDFWTAILHYNHTFCHVGHRLSLFCICTLLVPYKCGLYFQNFLPYLLFLMESYWF